MESNCCKAGMLESYHASSDPNIPSTVSYNCKKCDKTCDPQPDTDCVLFLFPNGRVRELSFPKTPRGLRINNFKPKGVLFGQHLFSHISEENRPYELWQSKCRLLIEPPTEHPKPQPKPLQLEVGKQYVRRDGEVSGVITRTDTHKSHPYNDGPYTYTPDGRQGLNKDIESTIDLISKVSIDSRTNPTITTQAESITVGVDVQKDSIHAQFASHFQPEQPIKANDYQPGGIHYIQKSIQPWDYIAANNLGFFEGNAIKYITRHKDKNGIEDLKKAIHYLEKLIEIEQENHETKTN